MIHFVVALRDEALPVIAHYQMHRVADATPFLLYGSERARLVISGSGKTASAAATAYLGAYGRQEEATRACGWINLGIAGHRSEPLGESVLSHKITDAGSGRTWYPPLVFPWKGRTADVMTVEKACEDYPTAALYEMEAAGFYPTACRFDTAELIHCLKVVSDSPEKPASSLRREDLRSLVGGQIETVERLVTALEAMVKLQNSLVLSTESVTPFLDAFRFTVSEKRQLQRLLQRLKAIVPSADLWSDELEHLRENPRTRGAQVLDLLRERLTRQPTRLATTKPARDSSGES